MKTVIIILAVVVMATTTLAIVITRDASQVTPDYKSYLVEVAPGIKIHVLEVGEAFPVFLQHGNPTSGFLYRKIAAELPADSARLIMPTLAGLGFSSKIPVGEHTLDNHMRWIFGSAEPAR